MCDFPVPLGPRAMTYSHRPVHSHRANSCTCILFSLGIALKSKLSRLLAAGIKPLWHHWYKPNCEGGLDPVPDHPPFAVDQFELDQPGQERDVVQPFGGALARELFALPQKDRQLQRFQMMRHQNLRRVGHGASPDSRDMSLAADVIPTPAHGRYG